MTAAGYSYRYAPLTGLEIPPAADWLGQRERAEHDRLRDPGRRQAWLAGRWLAKQLLLERLQSPSEPSQLRRLEIHSRDAAHRHVRPQACYESQPLTWSLSISRSARGVLVAVAPSNTPIGVDLVDPCQPLARGFQEVWFTPEERSWIICNPGISPTVVWSAKEAAYKALNRSEPFVPRSYGVQPHPGGRLTCQSCQLTIWQTPQHEFAVLATSAHLQLTTDTTDH